MSIKEVQNLCNTGLVRNNAEVESGKKAAGQIASLPFVKKADDNLAIEHSQLDIKTDSHT